MRFGQCLLAASPPWFIEGSLPKGYIRQILQMFRRALESAAAARLGSRELA
jgi:hypothetical protein